MPLSVHFRVKTWVGSKSSAKNLEQRFVGMVHAGFVTCTYLIIRLHNVDTNLYYMRASPVYPGHCTLCYSKCLTSDVYILEGSAESFSYTLSESSNKINIKMVMQNIRETKSSSEKASTCRCKWHFEKSQLM